MDRSVLPLFTRARPIFPELTRLFPISSECSSIPYLSNIFNTHSNLIFFLLICPKHRIYYFKRIEWNFLSLYIYISTNIHSRLLIRRQDTRDKEWINIRRDNSRKRETVNCVNWHMHIDSTQLFAIVIDLYY